jgi:protein phosphatase 4 regulatory subunit 3
VLDLLLETMPRDNLISSACLELFEHIKKETIRELVKHMVENYRPKLQSLSYLEVFRTMINRYDQTSGFTANMEFFLESEQDGSRDRRRNRPPPHGNLTEHLTMDEAQEEYWNTSDDEEDIQLRSGDRTLPANGESPGAKLLVDYASDEEPDDNIEAGAISSDEDKSQDRRQKPDESSMMGVTPPERVSEKRRREEEEEDDLSKMVQHKRRNSTSAGHNTSSTSPGGLRKKKGAVAAGAGVRDAGGGPKKIAISLSTSTAKTGDLGYD